MNSVPLSIADVSGADRARWPLPPGTITLLAMLAATYAIAGYVSGDSARSNLDPDRIVEIGRTLCRTGEFAATPGTPTVLRGPAYPAAAAVACKLGGADPTLYLPLINGTCCFLLLCVLAMHPLARDGAVRLCALAAVAFDPLLLNYAGRGYLEPMLILSVALVIAAVDRVARDADWRSMVTLGLAWGASLLVKPILIYLAIPLLPALALVSWRAARSGLGACVIALLVIAPWTMRNLQVTGRFIPVATGGWEIMLKGDTFARFVLQADGIETLEAMAQAQNAVLDRELGIADRPLEARESFYQHEILRRLRSAPLAFVRQAVVQSITFWVLGGDRMKTMVFAALQIPLLAVFGVAVWQTVGSRRRAFFGLAVVGTYVFAVYIASLAIARYSMPLRPWIVLVVTTFIAERVRVEWRARCGVRSV